MNDCYKRTELYRARLKREKTYKILQDYVNSLLAALLVVALMSIAILLSK